MSKQLEKQELDSDRVTPGCDHQCGCHFAGHPHSAGSGNVDNL